MANDTISQVHIGESNYDICDVKNREDVKDLQTYIDEEMYSASEVDDLLSTKVDEADFVDEPTGKEDGIEIVLPQGTPTSPIVLSEIDDSDELKHSTVHTSSNHYINTKLEAINNSLAGKMSIQFVDELPVSPDRNTQYYVKTETAGTWDIYIVDNTGTVHPEGSTQIEFTGIVLDTRRIAGISLNADITAQQLDNSIKDLTMSTKQDSLTAETVSTVSGNTKVSGIDLTENKSLDTTVENIGNYLINKIFPIGSLYTTTTDDNPNSILGVGTWQIVATNRVLWGVDASTTAGSELDEQLPNIKSTESFSAYGFGTGSAAGTYGLLTIEAANNNTGIPTGGRGHHSYYSLDASNSSSTYTDNGIVRPAAYTVHIWERTA